MTRINEAIRLTTINYLIRPLTKGDSAFQEEMLYQSLYVQDLKEIFPREIVLNPLTSKYVKNWGRAGDYGLIVEDKETKDKIGAAWYRLFSSEDKGFGFINSAIPELSLAIEYQYRNKGIGTHLLLSIINYAKNSGLNSLSMAIMPENEAINLYYRLGFEVQKSLLPHLVLKLDLKH